MIIIYVYILIVPTFYPCYSQRVFPILFPVYHPSYSSGGSLPRLSLPSPWFQWDLTVLASRNWRHLAERSSSLSNWVFVISLPVIPDLG